MYTIFVIRDLTLLPFGIVGYEGRYDYTANGNVVNLASRLCDEAKNGQILISHKAYIEVENRIEVEEVGERELKGFAQSIAVYNVMGQAQASG